MSDRRLITEHVTGKIINYYFQGWIIHEAGEAEGKFTK